MKKSLFITFEGGEGAGKTTLIESVYQFLLEKKLPVIKTREPGGTKLGEKIRELLLHGGSISPMAELTLFLASRAQHIAELIQPALKAGKIVLCDRFNDSTIAYQGHARGLGMEFVEKLCMAIAPLKPDLTLYLDIDPKIGLARAKKAHVADRIEQETIQFHAKIREGFHRLQQKDPERFHLLDASHSPAQVFSLAKDLLLPLI